jgi:hypothetical protein
MVWAGWAHAIDAMLTNRTQAMVSSRIITLSPTNLEEKPLIFPTL